MAVPDPFTNLEPDNEAILKAAAALIRAHKFADARHLLNSIPGNPTAQAWLNKLTDPRYNVPQQPKTQPEKASVLNTVGPMYKTAMSIIIIIGWFILLIVVWPALANRAYQAGLIPLFCLLPAIGVALYQIITKRRWPWY